MWSRQSALSNRIRSTKRLSFTTRSFAQMGGNNELLESHIRGSNRIGPVAMTVVSCDQAKGSDEIFIAAAKRLIQFGCRASSQADSFRAFTFAHLSFWAAAIFLRAAADIVLFFGIATTFCLCPPFLRTFAHRALWAAAILALPAADILRLVSVFLAYEPPLSAASAASSCSTVLAA